MRRERARWLGDLGVRGDLGVTGDPESGSLGVLLRGFAFDGLCDLASDALLLYAEILGDGVGAPERSSLVLRFAFPLSSLVLLGGTLELFFGPLGLRGFDLGGVGVGGSENSQFGDTVGSDAEVGVASIFVLLVLATLDFEAALMALDLYLTPGARDVLARFVGGVVYRFPAIDSGETSECGTSSNGTTSSLLKSSGESGSESHLYKALGIS